MGALDKKRDRSIDSLWRGNEGLVRTVEAIAGTSVGTPDGIMFIQDVGTKEEGKVYVDKNTGKLYKCIANTISVDNTFHAFSLLTLLDESTYLRSLRQSKYFTLKITPGQTNYYKMRDLAVYPNHIFCFSMTMDRSSRVFRGGGILQVTGGNNMTWEQEKVLVPMTGYVAGEGTKVEFVNGVTVPGGVSGHQYLAITVDAGGPDEAYCWIY